MQTNAPAGGEWVDQFNRAATFGQLDPTLVGLAVNKLIGGRVLAIWSNVEVANGTPLYTSLGTPKDVFGNTFVVPQGQRYVSERFFGITRSVSGTIVNSTDIRLYVGGVTIGAGNYLDVSFTMSASLSVSRAAAQPMVGNVVSTPCTAASSGLASLPELTSPQVYTTLGVNASPISNKMDIFASFISIPSTI